MDTNAKIKKHMFQNLCSAFRGWILYHSIVHKNHLGNGMIILIPERDEQLCLCSALYLNDLLIQNNREKAIFLSCDKRINNYIQLYSNNVKKVVNVTDQETQDLLYFYRSCDFDRRFIVASFKEPFGRNGEKIIEKYPDKVKELFAICIYKLKPYNVQETEMLMGKVEA